MNHASAQPAASPEASEIIRPVLDVETLKALADPIRLRLLSALMRQHGDMPVRSVKELAAELGEPQTKLYRHVRQLEAAGLIRAVSSRVVSGIVEQRYQACQRDLVLGPGLTDTEKTSADAEAAIAAMLDVYRSQYFAARREGLADSSAEVEPHRRALLAMHEARLPAARATEIRERLQQVLDDIAAYSPGEDDGENTVVVSVLVGYVSATGK
jgi:DNA-binding transcriptional ArsR family regulator